MQSLLQEIINTNIAMFLLIFMRVGMALMIMPGIGDSFVTPQVRLLFALALSLVLTPALSALLPAPPAGGFPLLVLLACEAVIGIFIGTVMRIVISALDTAGMVVATQAGFANAMIFNPMTASQGSVVGALLSTLGVTLLLTMNLHHNMLAAVVDSYRLLPANGSLPDAESMLEVIRVAVSSAFAVGIQIALPFIIVGLLVQLGFGVLGRLMPQVQIFFLALPVQILLSLALLAIVLSAGMLFWISSYESVVTDALSP